MLFAWEPHAEDAVLRQFLLGPMRRLHNPVARQIAAARDGGRLRDDLDRDNASFLIIALIQGVTLRGPLDGQSFELGEDGAALLSLRWRGLAHAPAATDTEWRRA